MAEVVAKMCKNLKKYYKVMNTPYEDDDGVGKFTAWCDENGYDDDEEALNEDLQGGFDQSTMVDFDDDFPLPKGTKEENKQKVIFDILKKCYDQDDPNFDNFAGDGVTKVTKETFESVTKEDITEMQKLYENQCPSIYNQGMKTEIGLLQIIAIGVNNNFDYLQNLVDVYDRNRIKNVNQQYKVEDFIADPSNKHFKEISKYILPRLSDPKQGETKTVKASELVKAAIISYQHRCCSKLLFNSMMRIDHSLEDILSSLDAAINFVTNLINTKTHETVCPFQFDLCIAVGPPIERKSDDDHENDSDGDDDEDDETPDDEPKGYIDFIGDIQPKLDNNKLININMDIGHEFVARNFDELLKGLKDDIKETEQDNNYKGSIYPFRKRLISMMDLRTPKQDGKNVKIGMKFKMGEVYYKIVSIKKEYIKCQQIMHLRDDGFPDQVILEKKQFKYVKILRNDKCYLYEPPKGKTGIYTKDIPSDVAPEWGIAAARTCLLPPIQYNEDKATNPNEGANANVEENDIIPDTDTNIHAAFHAKGGLLTFSFQCKASDQIKCYMYFQGQMIRFFPDEIEKVFSQIFNMDREDNQIYFKNEHFKTTIINIKDKLEDKKFNAFISSL